MNKSIILLIVGVFFSLSFLSMIPAQEDTYRFVWLTKKDWKELEKVSTKGKNTTAVVSYKTRLNIITTVQYSNEKATLTKEQHEKLEAILSKYE